MKKFIAITFLILSTQLAFSAAGKLIDLLINESGITKIVGRIGLDQASSNTATDQLALAVKILVGDDEIPTRDSILKAISDMDNTPDNAAIKRSLALILNKSADDANPEDVKKLMNDLITLAGVKSSLHSTCSGACGLGSLSGSGINVSLREITDETVLKLMSDNVIPSSAREQGQFISNKLTRLGLGQLKDAPADLVGPEDRQALAVFLALAEEGSPATDVQRKYIQSVIEFSKRPDGSSVLLDGQNHHKLWSVFIDGRYNSDSLAQMSEVIEQAALRGQNEKVADKGDIFYDVLNQRANRYRNPAERTEALQAVDALRVNKCLVGK